MSKASLSLAEQAWVLTALRLPAGLWQAEMTLRLQRWEAGGVPARETTRAVCARRSVVNAVE